MKTFNNYKGWFTIFTILGLMSPCFLFSQWNIPYLVPGPSNSNNIAVPFLLITPDARAGGMGDGGIAISDDANASHWNISNLAFAKKRMGISISYTPWLRALLPDINHSYLALYYKPDSLSAVTASFRYFSMGTVTYMSSTGATLGQFRPNEFAFDAGYTRRVSEHVSLGLSARGTRSNLTNGITIAGQDTKAGMGFMMDASGSYHSNLVRIGNWSRQLITGISLRNVGPKMSYANAINKVSLPTRMGIAQGIILSIAGKHRITSQVELSKMLVALGNPAINPWSAFMGSAGMEYVYNEIFVARAGYFYEPESIGGREYATFGAGIKYNIVQLDLAYLLPTNGMRSPLEDTLRFSLLLNMDSFNIQPRGH